MTINRSRLGFGVLGDLGHTFDLPKKKKRVVKEHTRGPKHDGRVGSKRGLHYTGQNNVFKSSHF